MMRVSLGAAMLAFSVALFFSPMNVLAQERQPRFFALVVGVSQYDGPLSLKARLDEGARQMKLALERFAKRAGYSDIRTKLLVDRDNRGVQRAISVSEVYQELRSISIQAVDSRDTLVLFFTGHGVLRDGEMYLFASGATENDDAYYIQVSRLFQRLGESSAATKLVFIDACQVYSDRGAMTVSQSPYGAKEMQSLRQQGTAAFYASSQGHKAYIDDRSGFGFFTKELIDIMNRDGRDGLSSSGLRFAADLDEYLKREVRRKAADSKMIVQLPEAQIMGAAKYDLMPLISRVGRGESVSQIEKTPPATGMRLTRDVVAGDRIMSSMVELWPKGSAVPDSKNSPWDFDRDLRGACFLRGMKTGAVVRWDDVGGCKQ